MGELEPNDSRDVTLTDERAPGEPPRTGPREGETRGRQEQQQGGKTPSDWRDKERAREEGDRTTQDHDKAGGIANGIGGPSPRPEADDGQWSQDAQAYDGDREGDEDEYDIPTQPMQGWYEEEDVIRFGAAVREMMREPYPSRQAYQAERGGR